MFTKGIEAQGFPIDFHPDDCVKLANHWETDISEIHSIFFDILQYNSLEVLLLRGPPTRSSRGMSLQTCFEISCRFAWKILSFKKSSESGGSDGKALKTWRKCKEDQL